MFVYMPYVDEHGTGMQRYCSEMILALLRVGAPVQVLIGELHGRPAWLEDVPYRVMLGRRAVRWVPRGIRPVIRILWLQFVLPFFAGRHGTLLALAHELALLPAVRQVAVVHDLTQFRSYATRRGWAEGVRNRLWVWGLRRSERIIAISEATKSDLIENLGIAPSRIEVVYEGYDPAIFRPAQAREEGQSPYLLYVGTLAPNKNLPFLLQVYAQLRQRFDIRIKLVGKQDPATVAELLATVPEATRSGIEFVGFVSDPLLAQLLQRCAAFVFPSLNEGFGLAVVEAMACGAPVISSDAGSLAEVVGQGGVLLAPTDAERWIDEIARVLTESDYRAELAQRAVRRSAIFSWDQAAQRYWALLSPKIAATPAAGT